MCTPYVFIDASTERYEEEGDYEEEEEENFDHCTNQGKLIPMQAIVRHCKTPLQFNYLGNLTYPKILSCKLLLLSQSVIVDLCLSLELLQELKVQSSYST